MKKTGAPLHTVRVSLVSIVTTMAGADLAFSKGGGVDRFFWLFYEPRSGEPIFLGLF